MVKHTQTIRREQPTICLSVFGHFVGLGLKGLKYVSNGEFLLLMLQALFTVKFWKL